MSPLLAGPASLLSEGLLGFVPSPCLANGATQKHILWGIKAKHHKHRSIPVCVMFCYFEEECLGLNAFTQDLSDVCCPAPMHALVLQLRKAPWPVERHTHTCSERDYSSTNIVCACHGMNRCRWSNATRRFGPPPTRSADRSASTSAVVCTCTCHAFRGHFDTGITNVRLSWPAAVLTQAHTGELQLFLARFPNLNTLDASNCGDNVFPPVGIPSLTSLDLTDGIHLQDIHPLIACTALTSLNLSGCASLDDISPLQMCTALRYVFLCGCTLLDDVFPLAFCINLAIINVLNCPELDPQEVNALGLALPGCRIIS